MTQLRRGLLPEWVKEHSALAQRRLLDWEGYRSASTLAIYAPLKGEVETWEILAHALENRKLVCFPRTRPGSRELELVPVDGAAALAPGSLGVREPAGPALPLSRIQLLVLPGLAFDIAGHRLGRGGGYYDETLTHAPPETVRAALCFEVQLLPEVPVDAHDEPVDLIVTEERVVAPRPRSTPK